MMKRRRHEGVVFVIDTQCRS